MNEEIKYIPEIGLTKNYSQIKVDKTCAQYLTVSNKNLIFDTAEEAVECANKMLEASDKTFYYMADPTHPNMYSIIEKGKYVYEYLWHERGLLFDNKNEAIDKAEILLQQVK